MCIIKIQKNTFLSKYTYIYILNSGFFYLVKNVINIFVWHILDCNYSIFCILRWPFPCCSRVLAKWIRLHKRQLYWGQSTSKQEKQSNDVNGDKQFRDHFLSKHRHQMLSLLTVKFITCICSLYFCFNNSKYNLTGCVWKEILHSNTR